MLRPYEGKSRRLIVAFDVGTTFSGVSYCLLKPGEVPKICSVTQFPGQEHASGSTKIPTVLLYDRDGKLCAAGAEANLDENVYKAEMEQWAKAEWFKPRLRPKSMPVKLKTSALPPLPPSTTLSEILADFLAYLYRCAKKFIHNTHPTVAEPGVWARIRSRTTFVIGHPNGWEGSQQGRLRQAAVKAGLVPDTPEGRSRVTFVSEGEASLHYCLKGGLGGDLKQRGFIIADLGGGTLDFSAYQVVNNDPLQVEEIAASKCELEGSTFVTLRAKGYLKHKLRAQNSPYASDAHVSLISSRFDETAKRTFRSSSDICLVPFGSLFDTDLPNGINAGKLKLSGVEVAAFFEPAIDAAVNTVSKQMQEAAVPVSYIFLVGGFSASPYFTSQLRRRLGTAALEVSVPDGQTSKAVADGAVSFYMHNFVTARVAKLTYGVVGNRTYREDNPEHVQRKQTRYLSERGYEELPGAFHVVLVKGTAVTQATEFQEAFTRDIVDLNALKRMRFRVWAYRGEKAPPWINDRSLTKKLCSIHMDLSSLRESLSPRKGPTGVVYWRVQYSVVLSFGGPELKAQYVWKDAQGIEHRSEAQILYDDFADESVEQETADSDEDSDNIAQFKGRMSMMALTQQT